MLRSSQETYSCTDNPTTLILLKYLKCGTDSRYDGLDRYQCLTMRRLPVVLSSATLGRGVDPKETIRAGYRSSILERHTIGRVAWLMLSSLWVDKRILWL